MISLVLIFAVVFLLNNSSSNAYGENSPASWKGKISLDTQETCLGFSCTIVDQENGEFEFTYDGVWNINGHGTFNQKVSVSGSECNGQGSTSGTLKIEGYVDQGQIHLQISSDPGIVWWTNHCIYPYGDQSTNHLVELQSIWYGEGAYILPLSSNANIDKTKDLDFGTGHWVLTISSNDFSSDVSNSGESPTKTEKPKLVPSNDFAFGIDVPTFANVKQGNSVDIPVTVTLVKGEPSSVSLSTTTWQDSLGISGWLEPNNVTPNYNVTLKVKTSCNTPPDNYQFYVNGISTSGNGASSTDMVTVKVESSDCDTQISTKKITAESSFGSLQINSPVFSASKYSSDTITVSGGVTTILRGTPITLQIIKPDNTIETQGIIVKKDGDFSVPVIVNSNWPLGNYAITASYGDNEIGTVYFQVISENAKTTIQTTKILTYENKQYGFSVNYPSTWQKDTTLDKDSDKPNRLALATFFPPQQDGLFMIGLAENDPYFKGLDEQQLLDTIKQELTTYCTDPDCTDLEFLSSGVNTHVNGYKLYYVTFTSVLTIDENTMNPMFVYAIIPDGDDFWLISTSFFNPDTFDKLSTEITPMAQSFTIFNYEGAKKQFSLHSKASQKNDIVYLAIKNPKDSSDDIYGIKLTNINGKITNFLKIKGWNYVRVGTDSVMYQTTSSPLTPSDLIKIALKVDSKNTEIKWEAFSKGKTSLGTGIVKP